jgi:hypothetical protein
LFNFESNRSFYYRKGNSEVLSHSPLAHSRYFKLLLLVFSLERKAFVFYRILVRFLTTSLIELKRMNSLPSKCNCAFYYFVKVRPKSRWRSVSSFLHKFRYLFFWISKNLIHSSTSDSIGSMKTILSWLRSITSELLVEFLAADRPFDFWSKWTSEFLVRLNKFVFLIRTYLLPN